jgi:hypothetical protein
MNQSRSSLILIFHFQCVLNGRCLRGFPTNVLLYISFYQMFADLNRDRCCGKIRIPRSKRPLLEGNNWRKQRTPGNYKQMFNLGLETRRLFFILYINLDCLSRYVILNYLSLQLHVLNICRTNEEVIVQILGISLSNLSSTD